MKREPKINLPLGTIFMSLVVACLITTDIRHFMVDTLGLMIEQAEETRQYEERLSRREEKKYNAKMRRNERLAKFEQRALKRNGKKMILMPQNKLVRKIKTARCNVMLDDNCASYKNLPII